ncbi:helix-turn-helix domain-containing protein [bacterium]|nr:helix-turn-helix domain-containing protein [bacterium]
MNLDSPWMTVAETAIYIRLSVTSVRRLLRSQKLKASRKSCGRVIRIHRQFADAYLLGFPTKLTKRQKETISDLHNEG